MDVPTATCSFVTGQGVHSNWESVKCVGDTAFDLQTLRMMVNHHFRDAEQCSFNSWVETLTSARGNETHLAT